MTFLRFLAFLSLARAFEKMSCINFYGIETENAKPVCSWVHPPEYYLDVLIDQMDLNSIRIPFSGQYVQNGDFTELDNLVSLSADRGLKIILDYHRIKNTDQSPNPMDGQTFLTFMDTWIKVLNRYQSQVYAVSLFNEDQGTDTNRILEYSLSAIYTIEVYFPNVFIYIVGSAFWNQRTIGLEGLFARINPERVMVDVHWYPFIGDVSYLQDVTSSKIPVDNYFVGEFGWTRNEDGWFYNVQKWSTKKGFNKFCAWTIAHSDLGGTFWNNNCETPHYDKMAMFKLLFPSRSTNLRTHVHVNHSILSFPPTKQR